MSKINNGHINFIECSEMLQSHQQRDNLLQKSIYSIMAKPKKQ